LTMIMNEQQTMPYNLSDEIASEPYNRNWDNLLLIGLNFTAGSNQTSRRDIKINKYIWLLLFFLLKSLKACVNTAWQSNYTLINYDTFIKNIHTLSLISNMYWLFHARLDIVTLLLLVYYRLIINLVLLFCTT
jgi:hypothetical protein